MDQPDQQLIDAMREHVKRMGFATFKTKDGYVLAVRKDVVHSLYPQVEAGGDLAVLILKHSDHHLTQEELANCVILNPPSQA